MPLPEHLQARVRSRVVDRLPPQAFTVATPSGDEFTTRGYLDDTRGALDALGQRERDGRLYLPTSEPGLAPGDQLDDRWVAWSGHVEEGGWLSVDVRRLPTFEEWTRTTRAMTGRDAVTRAPVYEEVDSAIQAYHLTRSPSDALEEGRREDATVARLIVPTGTTALAIGDRVSHPTYGRYRVTHVAPYGPWATASVEAA